jgi:hypothetical protein
MLTSNEQYYGYINVQRAVLRLYLRPASSITAILTSSEQYYGYINVQLAVFRLY